VCGRAGGEFKGWYREGPCENTSQYVLILRTTQLYPCKYLLNK